MGKVYTINDIAREAEPLFIQNNVVRAFLFGSYAYGIPDEQSDIDIALDTEGKISLLRVCGVMEELSQTLGKDVDLFDFREIEPNGGIMNEIVQRGILIYETKYPGNMQED